MTEKYPYQNKLRKTPESIKETRIDPLDKVKSYCMRKFVKRMPESKK
jgi:hypothetical protein